jgi:DNA-binding XRE family transcriptional regulator
MGKIMEKKETDTLFSAKLFEYRSKRGWSQAMLAKHLKVNDETVRRWEKGETWPNNFARQQLCILFEVPPEELGLGENPRLKRSLIRQEHLPERCEENAPVVSRSFFWRWRSLGLVVLCLLVIGGVGLAAFFSLHRPSLAVPLPARTCYAQTCYTLFPHQTDGGTNPCLRSFRLLNWKNVYDSEGNVVGQLKLYGSETCHAVWGSFQPDGFPFQRFTLYTGRRDPRLNLLRRDTTYTNDLAPVDAPMQSYDMLDRTGERHVQIFARLILVDSKGVMVLPYNTDTFHLEGSLLVDGF